MNSVYQYIFLFLDQFKSNWFSNLQYTSECICLISTYLQHLLDIQNSRKHFFRNSILNKYWIKSCFLPLSTYIASFAYLHKWLLSFWPTYPIRTRWAKRCPRQKCPDLGYRCCPFRCALGLGLNRTGLGQNRAGWLGGCSELARTDSQSNRQSFWSKQPSKQP